jgi:hypothetical protein
VVISLRHERCSLDLARVVGHLREAGLWGLASRLLLRLDGWHGPPVDLGDMEVPLQPLLSAPFRLLAESPIFDVRLESGYA